MGHFDLEKLHEIKDECKKHGFSFIVDSDTQEGRTRIMIDERGTWQKAQTLTHQEAKRFREMGFKPFVPDLINFEKKLIIEYQEEGKTGRGAHIGKKGHDELSDETKDLYYLLAGFRQLKLWESSTNHDQEIRVFLTR